MSDNNNPDFKKTIGIVAIYFVLLILAIPWYWPKDSDLVILGLPAWVFVAILISLFASIFTAFILLRYPWKTEIDEQFSNI
ncbi:MAG: DUF997 family protein [Proteobacteria bacterium]|nr:DUF997 family protein [Pseudomonadota bacterium]NOG61673.1 DUF997 family protein [Pseudomonadota bacterium]